MRRGIYVLAFVLLTVTGCDWDDGSPVDKPGAPGWGERSRTPPKYYPQMLQAKAHLSSFEGARARDVYLGANEDYKRSHKGENLCEAIYGVALSDAQIVLSQLNSLVFRLLIGSLASSPAEYSPAGGQRAPIPYRTSATAHDFGIEFDNLWSSIEPHMIELSAYAGAVTAIPDCTFSIGLGEVPEKTAGEYRYVLHVGDNRLPIVQLLFRGRLDGAEVRALEAFARTVVAATGYILAHDLSMTINVAKLAHLFGIPESCINDDVFSCGSKVENGEVRIGSFDPPASAFLFQDNPLLLTKSKPVADVPQADRWDRRMPYVHRDLGRGAYTMRTFSQALLMRSAGLQGPQATEQWLDKYFITYIDRNKNQQLDEADDLGLNLSAITLDCSFLIAKGGYSQAEADACKRDFATSQKRMEALLPLLRTLFTPSKNAVAELQLFFDRLYVATAAVDNRSLKPERIPINSFDAVIRDFFFGIIDTPTPPFLEFDVTAFFRDPKPLRDFVPYWQLVTNAVTGSRFIMDSDGYPAYDPVTQGTRVLTSPELFFDPAYAAFVPDWDSPVERTVLQGSYDGGLRGTLSNLGVPADCVNGANLWMDVTLDGDTRVELPVWYLALPDPAFNASLYVNLDAWDGSYGAGNGAACASDPAGMHPATNRTLTKGLWLYADFLVDHFAAAPLAQELLDALNAGE